eukprot:gene9282-8273_t
MLNRGEAAWRDFDTPADAHRTIAAWAGALPNNAPGAELWQEHSCGTA